MRFLRYGLSLTVSGLIALVSALSADAQVVRGLVLSAESGEVLAGALVQVIGPDGTRVSGALSGESGRYEISAKDGASIQASFVGMTAAYEVLGSIAASDTVFLDLRLESQAIQLGGLAVVGEERCGGDALAAVEVARVWQEARTALESIEQATDASLYRYDVETHVRRLDDRARRVLSESRKELPAWGRHPFRSPDPASLARDGYVQTEGGATMYYAPDVATLLSDDFLETHCFGIVRTVDDREATGLSFRPIDGRDVPDILGTFWLDSRTSQLIEVTFQYSGLERDIDTSELGGSIAFGTIDNGGWIVDAWNIRMPVVGLQAVSGRTERRAVVTAIEEQGGEVRRVRKAGTSIWAGGERGVIRGRVLREGSDDAAPGISVRLAGTSYITRSDQDGRFALRGLPDGIYELQAFDPVLTALGLDTVRTPVRPAAEPDTAPLSDLDQIVLRIPTPASELRRRCDASDGNHGSDGVLGGGVFDENSGVVIPDAVVRASWSRVRDVEASGFEGTVEWVEVSSDAGGRFSFCSLPIDVPVNLQASVLGRPSTILEVRLDAAGLPDVRLPIAAGDPITVTGTVRTASGESVTNAEVSIGERRTLTDEAGMFHVADVPPGEYSIDVSHLSARHAGDSLHVAGGAQNHVDIVMPNPSFELEGLSVEVTRGAVAAYRSRDTRVDVLTREQIDAASFGATSIASVLRHANVPGMISYETQFYLSDERRDQTRLGICIQLARNAGAECRMPEVYLNGVRLDRPHFELLSIDVTTMERVEILSAIEAQLLYPNARYGVLLLYTR